MAALTVRQLITKLEQYGDDMEVRFAYNYGDYWKTQVAATIDSVEDGYVKYSDYHEMDKVVDPNDDEEDDTDPDQRQVVILS